MKVHSCRWKNASANKHAFGFQQHPDATRNGHAMLVTRCMDRRLGLGRLSCRPFQVRPERMRPVIDSAFRTPPLCGLEGFTPSGRCRDHWSRLVAARRHSTGAAGTRTMSDLEWINILHNRSMLHAIACQRICDAFCRSRVTPARSLACWTFKEASNVPLSVQRQCRFCGTASSVSLGNDSPM